MTLWEFVGALGALLAPIYGMLFWLCWRLGKLSGVLERGCPLFKQSEKFPEKLSEEE
jgi:hypothetical protein